MSPLKLSNSPLDKCRTRPRIGDSSHVVQVAAGETTHLRKLCTQIGGQPIDDLRSPLGSLLIEDGAADIPVKQQKLGVHHPSGPQTRGSDQALQLLHERAVTLRQVWDVVHRLSVRMSTCLTSAQSCTRLSGAGHDQASPHIRNTQSHLVRKSLQPLIFRAHQNTKRARYTA